MESSPQNQQPSPLLPREEGIEIKKYIYLILSHWWWFGISIFVALTIAYLINRYSQEVYIASCSLVIGEEKSGTGTIESILEEFSRVRNKQRKAVVENELSILKSYKMARTALEELDFGVSYTAIGRRSIAEKQLYKLSPIIVIPDTLNGMPPIGTFYLTIESDDTYRLNINDIKYKDLKFGEKYTDDKIAFRVVLRDSGNFSWKSLPILKYSFTFNDLNSQAKAYSNNLVVDVNAEKGSILNLTLTGYVPEQISDYLNKLCEVYIRSNLDAKNEASINTIQFIDNQLRGIVDSLEMTGLRLQDFRSSNKVNNISSEGSYLYQKMQELQSEKAVLQINSLYYEYLVNYIEGKDNNSDIVAPSVIGVQDPLLGKLVSEMNELNLHRRNLDMSLRENTPQIAFINNEIRSTRDALKENLKSLVNTNKLTQEELDKRIKKIQLEVQKLPSTERNLINIQREFTINDQIYTFLLEKRAESGITLASNTSDHKILDIARPENSSLVKPRTSVNYMISLALGIGFPFLLLLLVQFFNTRITDRKYLEANLRVPIIGNIGHNEDNSDLPVSEKPKSSLSESFRALRTNLQYILQDSQSKVIAVTSAISGEGKTFCSLNLACILAMSGKKTLLISLDLRRPKVHKIFGLENKEGMSTYLINKTDYKDLFHEINIKNLFVTLSGPVPPNPAELIGSERMRIFIEQAKMDFDFIVIDTPPIAIVSDTLILKNHLDALVFVIRHNFSDKQVIELANSLYDKHYIKGLGIVVNDIQLRGYYGYSYRYGYGYGYSYSYSTKYYDDDIDKRGWYIRFKSFLGLNS